MHPETIIDAIGSHMTSLGAVFTWALVVAVGVAWAGLRNSKEIAVGGLAFDRRSAFYVVAALYLSVTVIGLVILGRIEALLILLPGKDFVVGYTKLASHEWVMNPFGYLGTSDAARRSAIWGTGLLIVGWWVCLASVYSLRGREPVWRSLFLPILFYATGLITLWQIYEIYGVNLGRLKTLDAELLKGVKETAGARWQCIYAAVPIGVLVFVVITQLPNILSWLHRRSMDKR